MCGIAGWIAATSGGADPRSLHAMTDALAHRGPDDAGHFFAATRCGRRSVALGHRRLTIIDLDTGHQPMSNEDGAIQVVFNGEIYNFAVLRAELLTRGHVFRSASDTETIVHAYEEYGDACVGMFRGMFAFALWDARRERLLLARDRFGKKPLFVCEHGNGLLFASEIKAILTHPAVRPKVDLHAVWDYFAYRYVPGPRTLFEGIRKLAPGSYAVWESGAFTERRFFTPPDCGPYAGGEAPGDPVGVFLELLDDAVRVRMVSDVPFGAFLSGGIDSSAVVAMMARHSSLPVKTFSVGFAEARYSELAHAAAIADLFGTEHHELRVTQQDMLDELPKLVRYRDAPVSEPSDIPIYLLSRAAGRSVKMVLTGEGSDEFLGGYPKHVFERYVGAYQSIPAFVRTGLIEPLVRALPYRFHRAKTAALSLGLQNREERMARWFGALSPREREQLVALRPPCTLATDTLPVHSAPQASALRCILCFDQTSWLPDNLLERGDRMTMAASIEARMPFMDQDLAGYVGGLPDRYRVRGTTTKWLLREAMKRVLPEAILKRPKVGFRVPVNEWLRGPLRDFLLDHLRGADSRTREYFHRQELDSVLDQHMSGRQNHEKLLWSLLNLEIWHRQYLVS